jgi:hypothetical protein
MEVLKIIVQTNFIHPNLGGAIETTQKEFEIYDGESADKYYQKEKKESLKSGGCYNATIFISNKDL